MPDRDPRSPERSAADASLASWLAVADRTPGEGSSVGPESGASSGGTLRLPAVVKLVKADLIRKWRSGQPVTLESYLEALPELGTKDTIPAELIRAEYEERLRSGEKIDLSEYLERFPHQAESFRRLIGSSGDEAASGSTSGERTARPGPSRRPPTATGQEATVPIRLPRKFGRYRIIKRLGQGGMGTVYLAYDSHLDRRVALKVPHVSPVRDAGAMDRQDLARFHREVRNAASLHHPNLCPVYDQGRIGGVYYVTMAHLKGRPLSALIDRDRPLPERWVASAVRQLATAMSEAHNSGVIHRDLKPSKIMVTSRRELVIMDFGLAWRVGIEEARLTKSGAILGTPAYMSPEQLSGAMAAMGPRCDIYSLGVILYELLTGRRPFEGPATAVMAQILFKDPSPPSVHRPGLDGRLEAICLKALAKRGEDRYGTMAELARALGGYLHDHPASPRPHPRHDDPGAGVAPTARDVMADPTAPLASADPVPAADPTLDEVWPGAVDPEAGRGRVESAPTEPLSIGRDDRARAIERASPRPDRPTGDNADGRPGAADPDSELKTCWRAWTSVVELLALRRSGRRLDPADYASLHGDLIRACHARFEASDEARRPLYESLETTARPWLTLKLLRELDREMIFDLLIRCRQADLELHGMPQAAQDLRDQIIVLQESASRPLGLAFRTCFALGLCLALFMILAMLFLAVWQPDWLR